MSENSMELMKQYGTYYVPTITAGKEVAEKAKIEGYYDELVVPKALAIGPKNPPPLMPERKPLPSTALATWDFCWASCSCGNNSIPLILDCLKSK